MKTNTRNITITALLVALSVALSYVIIPSPTGTVAFDSLPGFVAGAILGPIYGAVVGFFGHMATSAKVAFPLGIHSHLIIGVFMMLATSIYGYFYRRGQVIIAIIAAVIVNGVLSIIPFGFMLGWEFFTSMVLPLTIASLANILVATIVSKSLKGIVK